MTRSFVEYFKFILCEYLSFSPIYTTISVEGSLILLNNGFPNFVLGAHEHCTWGLSVTY